MIPNNQEQRLLFDTARKALKEPVLGILDSIRLTSVLPQKQFPTFKKGFYKKSLPVFINEISVGEPFY